MKRTVLYCALCTTLALGLVDACTSNDSSLHAQTIRRTSLKIDDGNGDFLSLITSALSAGSTITFPAPVTGSATALISDNDQTINGLLSLGNASNVAGTLRLYDDATHAGLLTFGTTGFSFNNALDLNTHQIHNVVDPTSAQDAATKKYVDDHVSSTSGDNITSGTVGTTYGGTGLDGHLAANGALLIGNGSGYSLNTLSTGTGIGVVNGSGTITISNTGVTSLAGTSNQVAVSGSTGSVTLSLPQDIHTGAAPTFASTSLSATSNQIATGAAGHVATINVAAPTGATVTYNIPNVGASDFVMTAGDQTLGGTKTFSSTTNFSSGLTATGGNITASQGQLVSGDATHAGTLSLANGSGASTTLTAPTGGLAFTLPTTGGTLATTAGSVTNFTGSLSGDVTGTQSATVASYVGTSTAANVHAAELLANAATDANTASTIVKRDASGNFTAGTITANLTGSATQLESKTWEAPGTIGSTTPNTGAFTTLTASSLANTASGAPMQINDALQVGYSVSSGGATYTIPDNVSVVDIADDGLATGVQITLPTGHTGQLLLIHNGDAQTTTGGVAIPSGSSFQLMYVGSSWVLVN